MELKQAKKKEIDGIVALVFWPYANKLRKYGNSCAGCRDPIYGESLRKAWGCDGPSQPDREGGDRYIYELGPDLTTDRCPLALMKQPLVSEASRLFQSWEQGITPNGGGLNDETYLYNQTMPLIRNLIAHAQEWYDEQQESKAKNKE